MKNKSLVLLLATAAWTIAFAQTPPNPITRPPLPRMGGPLPGLTPEQLAAFEAGRDAFTENETPETGLGPIFNGRSCVQCHGGPAPGGSSPIRVTRFGRVVEGVFDEMRAQGGPVLQRQALAPAVQERVPLEANLVVQRASPALFGLGLVEAIPDPAILANVGIEKPDGVRGRAAMLPSPDGPRVGRFGWKAQHAAIAPFAGEAYRDELGITNRLFPVENAPNGNVALLAAFDRAGDPEDAVDPATGRSDLDALVDFMRLLAPPPRGPLNDNVRAGETLFRQVGCASCHTPMMTTGPHPVAALSEKPVHLFSDLLLHDMGALADGMPQGPAGPNEMRTPPLWGLRASAPYLHDGRAQTVDEAIRLHDGEARVVRDRYVGMTPEQRRQLLDFLQSL